MLDNVYRVFQEIVLNAANIFIVHGPIARAVIPEENVKIEEYFRKVSPLVGRPFIQRKISKTFALLFPTGSKPHSPTISRIVVVFVIVAYAQITLLCVSFRFFLFVCVCFYLL